MKAGQRDNPGLVTRRRFVVAGGALATGAVLPANAGMPADEALEFLAALSEMPSLTVAGSGMLVSRLRSAPLICEPGLCADRISARWSSNTPVPHNFQPRR